MTRMILRKNNLQHPAKGGSTPAFACQHAAIAPLPCLNLQPWFSWFNFVWIGQLLKMQLQQESLVANTICFANVGCSPTPRQHFWKTAAPKNFQLPAACCLETMLLGKPIFHIRQKGVPPLLLPASVQQLPRCLVRIYNLTASWFNFISIEQF